MDCPTVIAQQKKEKALREAAPDLYAALEDGVRSHEPCDPQGCWCQAARVALARARGEEWRDYTKLTWQCDKCGEWQTRVGLQETLAAKNAKITRLRADCSYWKVAVTDTARHKDAEITRLSQEAVVLKEKLADLKPELTEWEKAARHAWKTLDENNTEIARLKNRQPGCTCNAARAPHEEDCYVSQIARLKAALEDEAYEQPMNGGAKKENK
jgi:hypothetical protein